MITFHKEVIEIQKRIRRWVEFNLGKRAMKPQERRTRQLEESLELFQALGGKASQAALLVRHVFRKEPGDAEQEFGGAALTLFACAEGCGVSLSQCIEKELNRIESLPPEKFRKRQDQNVRDGIGEPYAD